MKFRRILSLGVVFAMSAGLYSCDKKSDDTAGQTEPFSQVTSAEVPRVDDSALVMQTDMKTGWEQTVDTSSALKNGVQARFTTASRSDLEFKNTNAVYTYNLVSPSSKLVTSLENTSGGVYLQNTMDAYVTNGGNTYFASSSLSNGRMNTFRLGYYYYDVHILDLGFSSSSVSVSDKKFDILDAAKGEWVGNDISNISYLRGTLTYKVASTYDPYCYTTAAPFSASDYNAIEIEIHSTSASELHLYFFAGAQSGFNEKQVSTIQISSNTTQKYIIPLDTADDYTGIVGGVRIDCGAESAETITITSMKAVYADNLTAPVMLDRTFHTYSDKLHEELRYVAATQLDSLTRIGTVTRIPSSSVSRFIIKDAQGEHSSLDSVDRDTVEYAAFDIDGAGIFGYILPSMQNAGTLEITSEDGFYVINRFLSLPGALAKGESVTIAHRIYTDAGHDFIPFRREAYIERNPLEDVTVFRQVDSSSVTGYDPIIGAYVFETEGSNFSRAYYDEPNRHFKVPISIVGDEFDRRIYIKTHTAAGALECAAVIDEHNGLLPIPLEVCKNFAGEIEEPFYYPQDTAYGEVYFPLTVKADEVKKFTVLNLYQNWGKYPLKQLSSIQFFISYYHLSVGCTETNCIAPYYVYGKDGWTLPDFRALSGRMWASQPQHTSAGRLYFLNYTDSDGFVSKSEPQSAQLNSAGPVYADIDFEYLSDDGKIKAEYTHVEHPQTDETRTNYTIKLTVLEDISFNNFKNDFSFFSLDGRQVFYTRLEYSDINNTAVTRTLSPSSRAEFITLGKQSPYFCYYLPSNSTDAVNMALIVKNSSITINGSAYTGSFVLKNSSDGNLNYGALTLDLGAVTLKAGDVLELSIILLPWGNHDTTSTASVTNVRTDSCISPYSLSVETGTDISSEFVPCVRAEGEVAQFTLSGGTNNCAVRVYGFDSYDKISISEQINGQWEEYKINRYSYDGYQVYRDDDGTYSFAFVVDMTGSLGRTFRVTQE